MRMLTEKSLSCYMSLLFNGAVDLMTKNMKKNQPNKPKQKT